MRLYVILVISFIFIASLVGVTGYWVGRTGDQVLFDVARLQTTTLDETEAAARMTEALQRSQIAAHQIVAARYATLTDPSAWPLEQADHEWDPDPVTEELIDALDSSLNAFGAALRAGRAATLAGIDLAEKRQADQTGSLLAAETVDLVDTLEARFLDYAQLVERYRHEARYHPSEDVRLLLSDELEAHYRDSMLPAIERYSAHAQQGLEEQLTLMQTAFENANRRNLLLTAAALAGAIFLGVMIARSIARPLDQLQEALDKLGEGDLETRVELDTRTEIRLVANAFNQMAATLRDTTVSRSYLNDIIQSIDEMLFVVDRNGRIETVNRAALDTLGHEERELLGQPMSLLLAGPEVDDTNQISMGSIADGERRFRTAAGGTILVSVSSATLASDAKGAIVYLVRDITEHKAAERRLKASIDEKDILLKEVHHRVKNNLQVISSLLRLQSGGAVSDEAVRTFRESRNRIRSIALVHEHLYQSEDLANIPFRAYVQELVEQIRRSHTNASRRVEICVEVDNTTLRVDAAIPYGMMINELVSNCIEHAFPDGEGGRVTVTFRGSKGRHLEVVDNGIGLPPGMDPQRSDTLGLTLVRELAGQLRADLQIDTSDGTRVTVSSPGPGSNARPGGEEATATSGHS